MGRLCQSLILAKWNPLPANLPIETLVHANQTAEYQAIAASTAATDSAPFVEFMLEIIHQTLVQPGLGNELGKGLGNELDKRLGKERSAHQHSILRLMRAEPRITVREMAARLGVSTTTIENNIRKLRERQLVERVGGRRSGYWQCHLEASSGFTT